MLDEAGEIWNSIKNNFSDEVLKNSVSCEFHYLQSVNRHTSNLANYNEKRRYKKFGKTNNGFCFVPRHILKP